MESRESVVAEIERTKQALSHKAHMLEHRASETKHRIEQKFDIRYQMVVHPWQCIGAAFAVGMLLGVRKWPR